MCYSYKSNYKLLSMSSSFTRHNYKCSQCPPSAARTNINAIATIRPKRV